MTITVCLVGPVKSGKTTYLAGLLRASYAFPRSRRSVIVTPDPDSPETLVFAEKAADALCGKLPAASIEVKRYQLNVEFPGSVFFGIGRKDVALLMVDPPGGDCLPGAEDKTPEPLAEALRGADALLILLPARGLLAPHELQSRLASFADRIRTLKGIAPGSPAVSRAACVVTMADVLPQGCSLDRLENANARQVAIDLVGRQSIATIAALAPPGGDWYSLLSIYGFDRTSGAAVTHLGRDGSVDPDWWPYRPFEPLEFLARGFLIRDPWVPS